MKSSRQSFKKINEILRISIFLALRMFESLKHQRDEINEKHGQRNKGKKIGTKERNNGITKARTLVL